MKNSSVMSITKSVLSGSIGSGSEILSVKTADLDGVREISYKLKTGSDIHTIIIQKTMLLFIPMYSVLVKSSTGNVFEDSFISFSLGQDFNRQYRGHVSRIDISSKCLRQMTIQKLRLS